MFLFFQFLIAYFQPYDLQRQWSGYRQAPGEITVWDTGVNTDILKYIGAQSVKLPEDFVSLDFKWLSYFCLI